MDTLRIRLFGSLDISIGSRRLPLFATRKSRSLFSYLLLHSDRAHPRDVLAGTFWAECPEAVARKHLRDTLWRVRQVLRSTGRPGIILEVHDDSVSVELSDDGWLDTRQFESTLSVVERRPTEELSAAEAEVFRDALELYRGDLLEEIYDEWCVYHRQRLRLLALDALQRLVMFHLSRREWASALLRAQRLLAADPLHEDVHRIAMRCYACMGNRGAALRQFRTCERLLREELDVEPTPDTVALHDRIREGAPRLSRQMVGGDGELYRAPPDTLLQLERVDRDLARTRARLRRIARAVGKPLPE